MNYDLAMNENDNNTAVSKTENGWIGEVLSVSIFTVISSAVIIGSAGSRWAELIPFEEGGAIVLAATILSLSIIGSVLIFVVLKSYFGEMVRVQETQFSAEMLASFGAANRMGLNMALEGVGILKDREILQNKNENANEDGSP